MLRILEYTAEAAGASVIAAPSHITAQACRCCGASPRVPRTPAARVHGCSRCGCVADRDRNAAQARLQPETSLQETCANRRSMSREVVYLPGRKIAD
nr:MAG: hypothetical protein DIU80_08335 [Chloroflexota bacterium]